MSSIEPPAVVRSLLVRISPGGPETTPQDLTEEELFFALDSLSDELKRRNNIRLPPISDIKKQEVSRTVSDFIGALANLGVELKPKL